MLPYYSYTPSDYFNQVIKEPWKSQKSLSPNGIWPHALREFGIQIKPRRDGSVFLSSWIFSLAQAEKFSITLKIWLNPLLMGGGGWGLFLFDTLSGVGRLNREWAIREIRMRGDLFYTLVNSYKIGMTIYVLSILFYICKASIKSSHMVLVLPVVANRYK